MGLELPVGDHTGLSIGVSSRTPLGTQQEHGSAGHVLVLHRSWQPRIGFPDDLAAVTIYEPHSGVSLYIHLLDQRDPANMVVGFLYPDSAHCMCDEALITIRVAVWAGSEIAEKRIARELGYGLDLVADEVDIKVPCPVCRTHQYLTAMDMLPTPMPANPAENHPDPEVS